MNSFELRKIFQNYFTKHNHHLVSSASLIPKGDPSLLFVNAGMNQFKDFFLKLKKPPHPALCSIQKCLRVGGKHNDLEQVGASNHHHTFFEMMGFFSFGAYSKKQALSQALEFLTKILKLPQEKLWVSVLKTDLESATIWEKQYGFPREKIFFLTEKDNFWRMGDTGPCGPCSEIYYYSGNKKQPLLSDMIEVWNLVFMESYEDKEGRHPLPTTCIDTGMGLERITAILQGQTDNYQSDLFKPIIASLEKAVDIPYFETKNNVQATSTYKKAFRVLADHSRAVSFLITEGVLPGNEGPSYVLRRLLRRAFFYSSQLHPHLPLLKTATTVVGDLLSSVYPILKQKKQLIHQTIEKEELQFNQNLKTGKAILLEKIKSLSPGPLDCALVWDLYSTYGFPPDLTRLVAQEKGFTVTKTNIEYLKNQFNPKKSKNKNTFPKQLLPPLYKALGVQSKTLFTGYKKNQDTGCIIGMVSSQSLLLNTLKETNKGWIVLDKSCFYAEGGGAIGDTGTLHTTTGKAQVLDTQKIKDVIFHHTLVTEGEIKKNQACKINIPLKKRQLIASSHSATHLLNWSLRQILGSHIQQMGSLVEAGRLRFDFSHAQAVTQKQQKMIEIKITDQINKAQPVHASLHSFEQAQTMGALALKSEKYDKQQPVRVVHIGSSKELCGGIHVKNTSQIGGFKIISESGVQSGVRRITAYTHDVLKTWENKQIKQYQCLKKYLKLPTDDTTTNPFIAWLQKKEAEIKLLKKQVKATMLQKQQVVSTIKKSASNKEALVKKPSPACNKEIIIQHISELRHYLNLAVFKDISEEDDFFIPWMQKKEAEIKLLKKQQQILADITKDFSVWTQKATPFKANQKTNYLLSLSFPVSDKKLLIEVADSIKPHLNNACIIVLMGYEEKASHKDPFLVINVSSSLQNLFPAHTLFKNIIAQFLDGRGGGGAGLAQGIIKKPSLFPKLKQLLLKAIT